MKVKHAVRDGPRGEWGTSWRPTTGIAPLQNIDTRKAARAAAVAAQQAQPVGQGTPQTPRGWASYFINALASGEREYHDGDEDDDEEAYGTAPEHSGASPQPVYGDGLVVDETGEVDIGGGGQGWSELRVETVECEVPIRVWPGNTAFKPLEVIFDV